MHWFWESEITCSNHVVLTMGQKVSSVSFRLGKRLCWSDLWTTKTNHYGIKLFKVLEKRENVSYVLRALNARTNKIFVRNSNLTTDVFINVTENKSFDAVFGTLPSSSSRLNLKNKIKDVCAFTNKDGSVLNLSLTSLTGLRQKTLNKKDFSIILPILSAQILSDFIAEQINDSETTKNQTFKHNLLGAIARLAMSFLKQVKLSRQKLISGLKIECYGKWKQTSSGRKQKLLFTVGSVKKQSLGQFLSFGFSTVNTKYGSCSVKVWISFRSF